MQITGIINNCYYAKEIAIRGDNISGQIEPKYAVYMKTTDFVTKLNAGGNNWKLVDGVNNNYPVLSWEYPDNPVATRTEYAEAINIDSTGYDAYVYCGKKNVEVVSAPTWTWYNDQDDMNYIEEGDPTIYPWKYATKVEEGIYHYRVNISDHKNEHGGYITQFYIRYTDGTQLVLNVPVNVPE